jgi:GntR family transcriptional regulator, transcriptional repressor for pyruvate dehydrogenase complex
MLQSGTTIRKPSNIREKAAMDRTAIYSSIARSIRDGTLPVGSKLPTERELSLKYDAARNTVRNTMNTLVEEGLVTRHVGRGTFVAGMAAASGTGETPQDTPSLPEILEARLLFEPELAHLVVQRAGAADFAEMDRCLGGIRDAEDWLQYKEWKYALHMAIICATRNRFLIQIFEGLIKARRQDAWGRRGQDAKVPASVREASLLANREIVTALRDGDADAARAAMHDYLTRTLVSVHGF